MNGDRIHRIVAEIEFRHARRSYRRDKLPHLIAIYVHQDSVSRGSHGEVIHRVLLAFGQLRFPLLLGLRSLAILDVLIRHKLVSAAQIERMLRTDSFCLRLGASFNNKAELRMNRNVIKVYIQRIRKQLEKTLRKAGSECSSDKLLVSEATDLANVVAYRLAVPCEIVHRNINNAGGVRPH